MTLRLTDTIIGKSRVTADDAYAYAVSVGAYDLPFLREMFDEYERLCDKYGFAFEYVVGQSKNETGAWSRNNPNWRDKHNPAGLAITNSQNLSLIYRRGRDAARAHIAHLYVYRFGAIPEDTELHDYIDLDGHYWEAVNGINSVSGKPFAGSVRTIADFNNNGTWALLDRNNTPTGSLNVYGTRILNDTRAVFGELPDQQPFDPPVDTPSTDPEPIPGEQEPPVATYNYDNGVPPDYEDYEVSDAIKFAGWIDPDDHFIAAVVLHSAYGGLVGSTGWFQDGHALTDYMVGNSFDGPKLDGELRRFNDPYGDRYAWASGPVSNPIDDAAKFLEIFGPNKEVVNMFTTAIERSCAAVVATNPVTEKEHAKRCAVIAYHANRYGKRVKALTGKDGFTCDTFPLIPGENNRSFLIYHGEINSGKRNTCPDPLVRKTIDRIIADVRVILAGWQKGTTTIPPQVPPEQMPTYAPVKPIPALQVYKDKDAAPSFVTVGSDRFVFVNDRVRATKQTPRYQTANTDGDKIGPDIEKGLEFAVLWLFWDEKGEPWFISPYWTRIRANDTERIADAA